jgi:hypothetical protein
MFGRIHSSIHPFIHPLDKKKEKDNCYLFFDSLCSTYSHCTVSKACEKGRIQIEAPVTKKFMVKLTVTTNTIPESRVQSLSVVCPVVTALLQMFWYESVSSWPNGWNILLSLIAT